MTESFRPTSFRKKARAALKGKWGMAVAVALIYYAIFGALQVFPHIVTFLAALLVVNVIAIGVLFIFLDVSNGKEIDIKNIFEGFKDYGRYILGLLLVFVYTLLWTLLLIIPGIIKSISYSMTPYLMRENPEMEGEEAIRLSMKMMYGHKMDYFLLQLSFIGWALLCILTLGIGLLWLVPYILTAEAEFYKELKKEQGHTTEACTQTA